MKRSCRISGDQFEISPEDLEFYKKVSPVFSGRSFEIPPPTLSSHARLQRRMSFRNESNLYRRTSELSGAKLISVYAPESPYKVITFDEWWGDNWDPMSWGRPFDPNRPFLEQLHELSLAVPHLPLNRRDAQNSEFTNFALHMKDCYLVFGASHCENCQYSRMLSKCRDVLDSMTLVNCELCYEGFASENCYNCLFFQDCKNCHDSMFLEACHSCNNCILCVGLNQKSYCIMNEYVGKEKFEKFRDSLFPLSHAKIAELKAKQKALHFTTPHRASFIYNSENCSGDMIVGSKNCHYCFDTINCEDSKFLYWTPKSNNSYDCCFNSPDGVELCYEVCSCLGSRSMGLFMAWNNDQSYYSTECHFNKNIFGCVGLRNKEYCILNKQYDKPSYEKLAAQIAEQMISTGDWGEYFPTQLSAFAYNETIAHEVFPKTKEEVLALGWKWRDEDLEPSPSAKECFRIPETIESITDDVLQKTLICEGSARPYKVNPLELAFYRRMGLPLPKYNPKLRYNNRMSGRNEPKLWSRNCAKSGQNILTTYPPESQEIVWANEVYVKEFF